VTDEKQTRMFRRFHFLFTQLELGVDEQCGDSVGGEAGFLVRAKKEGLADSKEC
jgi:hypothetical protein